MSQKKKKALKLSADPVMRNAIERATAVQPRFHSIATNWLPESPIAQLTRQSKKSKKAT